jgi:Rrf2 family protein
MNNTRFATVMHILTLLARTEEGWLSSDYIAGSININPVTVRREMSVLLQAGLVVTCKGKEGGSRLAKSSEDISLKEVYLAVKNSEVLGKKNKDTNARCPIGVQMNARLAELFNETDRLVVEFLASRSLADFLVGFG